MSNRIARPSDPMPAVTPPANLFRSALRRALQASSRVAPALFALGVLTGSSVSAPGPIETGAEACAKARAEAAFARTGDRTEPTPNQRSWDARRYDLFLEFEPDSSWIRGVVRTRLSVPASNRDSLRRVELDLTDSMRVRFVQVNEVYLDPSAFLHEGDLLAIDLPAPVAPGSSVSLAVTYQGRAHSDSRDGIHFGRVNGRTIFYSFGGPRGARRWWPCKDHPEDKADTVTIRAQVPTGLEVASNGRLANRVESVDRTIFEWVETHPIATYLVSVAAYPYTVYEDVYTPAVKDEDPGSGDMPIVFYNYPESRADWEPVQAKVKTMLTAYAGWWGEYPFLDEKYGHAQIPFSGGMEHQTITCLGSNNELVVAHELAHQWWGDEVTCADFHDIWLNEGFATYAEALHLEHTQGREAYLQRMKNAQYFGPGSIHVDDVSDPDRIYNLGLSYSKGAWVLHMLRHVVGDETFMEILQTYRERQRDDGQGVARTADLAQVASELAARDLQPFFDAWIRGEGYPIYRYDWTATPDGSETEVQVRIRQVQDEPVFPMPIDLQFLSALEEPVFTATVWNTTADTTYVLTLPEAPVRMELDPEEWILRRVLEPIGAYHPTRQILLVNGVPWTGENGQRVRQQYADQVFTGGFDYDFWDYHPTPAAGYPAGVPEPIGHGAVHAAALDDYEAVIWVGGNFGGDDGGFRNSPLHSFLEAGGNLLVMALSGRTFLLDPYRRYLGIEWAEGDSTVTSYEPMRPGLPELRLNGEQSSVSLFQVDPGNDKVLLYAEGGDPARGLGVVRLPELDKSGREVGHDEEALPGHFVFLSGRPYRWNSDDLRVALRRLIGDYLIPPPATDAKLELRAPWPNPSKAGVRIAFLLPTETRATLTIHDVTGREVRRLRDAVSPSGWNAETWDGRDAGGRRAPSGLYFGRVEASGKIAATKVVRIR